MTLQPQQIPISFILLSLIGGNIMGNKAKKLQKPRKPMSPKTKATLINLFKSLFSNQAAIDGASNSAWWIAAIFLVFSVFIPLIPNYVTLDKQYGASFISSATYDLDRGLANATVELKKDGYRFEVEGGKMSFYKGEDEVDLSNEPTEDYTPTPIYSFVRTNAEAKQTYSLQVYITARKGSNLINMINGNKKKNIVGLVNTQYESGSLTPRKYDEESVAKYTAEGTTFYTPNFIVFTPNTMAAALYKAGTTTKAKNTQGGLDWTNTEKGDLLEAMLGGINPTDFSNINNEQIASIYKNWKGTFNETFIRQKNQTKWNTVLIYLGVYAGLIVFLGFMIFLLTRGKNNPFRNLNFWICQKIAWWSAASPAILGLILGFVLSGNMIGSMAFVLLASLRIMWLSMRQLRPAA